MDASETSYSPDYAVPPGWLLEEHIQSAGLSVEEFAQRCGCPPGLLVAIIAGEVALDDETAARLQQVTGMPAGIWLGISDKYQECKA